MDYELMANEELAVRAKEGDKAAEEVLYKHVRRLICRLAQPYIKLCDDGIDENDILQECWFGFHNAVRGYNPGKSLFTSYLGLHVKNSCREALGIRGRPKLRLSTVSLEEPVQGTDGLTIADMIVDESIDVTGGAELTDLQRVVRCAVSHLTERQQQLVHAVYVKELAVTEFARGEGISREAARQLKDKTLRDLRRDSGIRAFAPFYVSSEQRERGMGRKIDSGASLYLAWCADSHVGSREKLLVSWNE